MEKNHEVALTVALMCDRDLFGRVYRGLQGEYFWGMPEDSGVVMRPVVPTKAVVEGATRPGDIDLLVIPYERSELVVSRTLAVEIKVIRASFAKQSRSPNDFGASQVKSLWSLGFPYVALLHVIVSDKSPKEAWREMHCATILDRHGKLSTLKPVKADMLPADLMNRAFGRMAAIDGIEHVGIASAYLETSRLLDPRRRERPLWFPNCRPAARQERLSWPLMKSVFEYYEREHQSFIDAPRWDPPNS